MRVPAAGGTPTAFGTLSEGAIAQETIGQALPIIDSVFANPLNGAAQFAVSSEGTLVYAPGRPPSPWNG